MSKKTLNQSETVRQFAEMFGYSYKDADTIYRDVIQYLYWVFKNDLAITLRTIGTLSVHVRKPSLPHHVNTGDQYLTTSHPNVKFKTSQRFREYLRDEWQANCPEKLHMKSFDDEQTE